MLHGGTVEIKDTGRSVMTPNEKIDGRLVALSSHNPNGSVRANVMLKATRTTEDYDAVRRDLRALGVEVPEQPPFAGILTTTLPGHALRKLAALPSVEWIGAPAEDATIEELLDNTG